METGKIDKLGKISTDELMQLLNYMGSESATLTDINRILHNATDEERDSLLGNFATLLTSKTTDEIHRTLGEIEDSASGAIRLRDVSAEIMTFVRELAAAKNAVFSGNVPSVELIKKEATQITTKSTQLETSTILDLKRKIESAKNSVVEIMTTLTTEYSSELVTHYTHLTEPTSLATRAKHSQSQGAFETKLTELSASIIGLHKLTKITDEDGVISLTSLDLPDVATVQHQEKLEYILRVMYQNLKDNNLITDDESQQLEDTKDKVEKLKKMSRALDALTTLIGLVSRAEEEKEELAGIELDYPLNLPSHPLDQWGTHKNTQSTVAAESAAALKNIRATFQTIVERTDAAREEVSTREAENASTIASLINSKRKWMYYCISSLIMNAGLASAIIGIARLDPNKDTTSAQVIGDDDDSDLVKTHGDNHPKELRLNDAPESTPSPETDAIANLIPGAPTAQTCPTPTPCPTPEPAPECPPPVTTNHCEIEEVAIANRNDTIAGLTADLTSLTADLTSRTNLFIECAAVVNQFRADPASLACVTATDLDIGTYTPPELPKATANGTQD